MAESTVESLATTLAQPKQDWKAVATVLLSLLVFVSGIAWAVIGQNLRAASKELESNTKKVSVIEAAHAQLEQRVIVTDKRMDDLLGEIKSINSKVGTVAESQARMEGYILGQKK